MGGKVEDEKDIVLDYRGEGEEETKSPFIPG